MPKKVRDAIKLVQSDGWRLWRTRGSHRQYAHDVKPTYNSILKQAGLK